MGFVPLQIPPGVVKSESDYAAQGRWIDTEHVRFVRGLPEKLGGVQAYIMPTFEGIARAALAWASYTGIPCLMWGTACHLHLWREGTLSEITPFRPDATGIALTDPFETTDTSAVVEVTDSNHGIEAAGTLVNFTGASAVGGITIDGDYAVTAIIDPNTYTITHSAPASSNATGGGSVSASYNFNCGDVDPEYLLGWGVGAWGVGGWGVDASISIAPVSEPTNWSLDNWGEDVIVCRSGGPLYRYDTSAGVGRPSRIANCPDEVRYAFVTAERYVFALGCTIIGGGYDPMTVRWPDVEDITDWSPSDVDTANQRKLQGGTRLMAGTALAQGVSVVWSDAAIFLFQFTGSRFVYDSRQVGTHCGLIGPHAFCKAGSAAFWMSANSFWMYAGVPEEIPNVEDIQDWVFLQLNRRHAIKSFGFYNPIHNEVWFVFPAGVSTEPNTYVMVNLDDWSWSHGTWDRSAAALYTTGEQRPILFGTAEGGEGDNTIYLHDMDDVVDDDGAAMRAYLKSGPTDIQGGNVTLDVWGFVPDFQRQTGDMTLRFFGHDHPRSTIVSEDSVTIADDSVLVDTKVAGRQIGFELTSDVVGGDFRLGRIGIEVQGSARKRGSQV